MNKIQTTFECKCRGHILKVEYEDGQFYFYLFNQGNMLKSLWLRLKLAWQLIRNSSAFYDNVVLDAPTVSKLVNFLDGKVTRAWAESRLDKWSKANCFTHKGAGLKRK